MPFFDLTHPKGPKGTPLAQEGENQKSKLLYFLKKGPQLKSNYKNLLFFSTFQFDTAPRHYGLIKGPKRGLYPGWLN